MTAEGIYFQLARFLVTMILGVLATRMILMPVTERIMNRRKGSKKARHSFENIIALLGLS
ncbi:MAG: hypothetical protein ABEJ99_05585 [Candidatus Nanohaloarchaea archaeon]